MCSWTHRLVWNLPMPGSWRATPTSSCWSCGRITPTEERPRSQCSGFLLDGIPVMGVILNRCDLAQSDMYRYAFHYSLNRQGIA